MRLKFIFLAILFLVSANANEYNYVPDVRGDGFDGNYSKLDPITYGNFEKIKRYPPIFFGGENDSDLSSDEIVKKIVDEVKKTPTSDKQIVITGHTRKFEKKGDKISLNNFFTKFLQSIGQYDELDQNSSKQNASNYAKEIKDKLLDNNISKDIINVINKMGKDNLYSEGISKGRDLNDRVEVAIYYFAPEPAPIDTDKDGVIDYYDLCPGTPFGVDVDQNGCPRLLTLHLNFDFDSNSLADTNSTQVVKDFALFMVRYKAYYAHIIGHTDSAGSYEYNKKLSARRARVVKSILVKEGVDPKRISSSGRGESEPIADNNTSKGRAQNRRTEIELYIPKSLQNKDTVLSKRKRKFDASKY